MFKNIAPRRFLFSIILIFGFIGLTLYNLSDADRLFADIQQQLSDGLGWLIILLANGFVVFVIYCIVFLLILYIFMVFCGLYKVGKVKENKVS